MASSRDMFNAAPTMLEALEYIQKVALSGFRGDTAEAEALCVINNMAISAIAAAKPPNRPAPAPSAGEEK